ncbi:hypothetical protein CUMW_142650, partial [Citrus unshiu]
FNSFLNNHAVLRIASMAPPSAMRGEDRMYWGASNTGNFTVQSAYQVLTNFCPTEDCQDWQHVWKWKGPQSVRIFLWLLCHDRLKTGCELARRHLDVEAVCGRCHANVENSLHAIRDCDYSRGVWRKLVPALRQHNFFSYPLRQWIMTNLRRRVCDMGSLFWPIMFGIAAWRIWHWRNQKLNRGFVKFRNLARISRPRRKKRKEKKEGKDGNGRKGDLYVVEVVEEERKEMKGLLGEEFRGGEKWRGSTRLLLLDEEFVDKNVLRFHILALAKHYIHCLGFYSKHIQVVLKEDTRENTTPTLELVKCRLTLFYDYWQMN